MEDWGKHPNNKAPEIEDISVLVRNSIAYGGDVGNVAT